MRRVDGTMWRGARSGESSSVVRDPHGSRDSIVKWRAGAFRIAPRCCLVVFGDLDPPSTTAGEFASGKVEVILLGVSLWSIFKTLR
ncbi:MAG TPA: hypothetical protein VMU99_07635 [Acidimicrobiales bacterium]|nr:hypothetical protein [Acidimicrobiales bacterium]